MNKELSGLHEAAFLLGFFALLSQIVGLFRDRILAGSFGAGRELDLYYAAFRVPDLLYVTIASFVASTALIPFIYRKEHEGAQETRVYLSQVFTTFIVFMIVAGGLVALILPSIVSYLVPGFSPNEQATYVTLARILLLSPLFLGISNLFGSITQSGHRFFSYASAPIFYNLGIIIGAIWLTPHFGLPGLVAGVILGAVLHALSQVPTLAHQKLLPTLSRFLSMKDIRSLIALSLPRTLGLALHQIAMLFLIGIATKIESGSVAVFALATNLQNIPLMIVGSSYAVAAFPTLARLHGRGEIEAFYDHIVKATKHIVFWSCPAIVFFIVLRAQIVRSILGTGNFDWTATRLTAAALAIFVVSLVAHSFTLLFSRGYYAMGNTRLPLWINGAGALVMVTLGVTLIPYFDHSTILRYFVETLLRVGDIPGTSLLMIPLAFTAGMIVSMGLFLYRFRMQFPRFFYDIKQSFVHSSTSSVFGGYIAYNVLQLSSSLFSVNTFFGVLFQGLLAGAAGVVTWILLLKLMNNPELEDVWSAFSRRLWKTARPIAGEPEEL